MQKNRKQKLCKKCGTSFEIRLCESARKYCSQLCHYSDRPSGKKHFNWKGGKSNHNLGYIYVSTSVGKRTLEHRLVIERKIGRKLKSTEIIHHINGDKKDNRLKNLQILNRASHASLHHKGVPKKKAL